MYIYIPAYIHDATESSDPYLSCSRSNTEHSHWFTPHSCTMWASNTTFLYHISNQLAL